MTLKNIISPNERRSKLKELLRQKKMIRVIEAHNGISALIGNDIKIETNINGIPETLEFDALWESSLTDSASKGLPDIEIVSMDSRIQTIQQILDVTTKPIIVDGDTGRDPNSFEYLVSRLERMGVSAVIIEDKKFPKRNSLEGQTRQNLEDPDVFAKKITRGKSIQKSIDFMIIARLESLIAGYGVNDAINRARKYMLAGVDGIMIHSKKKNPKEIFEFSRRYKELCKELGIERPLICVPTTYNTVKDSELEHLGFNIVIYANHLLRASYKAMEETCKLILFNKRSFETDPIISPVKVIFEKVGFMDVKNKDKHESEETIKIIIPAAGEDHVLKNILGDLPKSMLEISGKSILQRQIETLSSCNLNNVVVIRGYGKEKILLENVSYSDVDDYNKGLLNSIMTAQNHMKNGFLMLYSDILFDRSIIDKLMKSNEDIVLVVDNSYPRHRHKIVKHLDLVIGSNKNDFHRSLFSGIDGNIKNIGKKLNPEEATHEFIGIVKFSKSGAENFIKVYNDLKQSHFDQFHESESFEKSSFNDIMQEMLDRGFKIHFVETHKGWMEIHNEADYQNALDFLPN